MSLPIENERKAVSGSLSVKFHGLNLSGDLNQNSSDLHVWTLLFLYYLPQIFYLFLINFICNLITIYLSSMMQNFMYLLSFFIGLILLSL